MSRAYRAIRPRANYVYSVEKVMELYAVCRNTVSNWIGSGLRPVDGRRPQLFRGAELARFHQDRRARSSRHLRAGEFKCLGCKAAVFPDVANLGLITTSRGAVLARGTCPDCDATVYKLLDETECNKLKTCLETNTNLLQSDETGSSEQLGIGKSGKPEVAQDGCNDRILHHWLVYAGRYDEKTVDAHLTAIRDFERFLAGKAFNRVATDDVAAWRADLIRRCATLADAGGLSRSTVRHRASHLRTFFQWLSEQSGFRHLIAVIGYFALPRRVQNSGELEPQREYTTLNEAVVMLNGLPSTTLKARRDRAIFATAFVAGLRKSALIALRLQHIDLEGKQVLHDGRNLGAKNGKSFIVDWFPRTEPFQTVIWAWYAEVSAMGLRGDDALFPDMRVIDRCRGLSAPDRPPIPPMRTPVVVDQVFLQASAGRKRRFTPHSARDTLAALGDQLCRTSEERKAWSLNLGHASEAITWRHYGRVTDTRKAVIFSGFDVVETWAFEDMDLMLQFHQHKLYRGTPEFERAERMVETYQRRSGGTAAE